VEAERRGFWVQGQPGLYSKKINQTKQQQQNVSHRYFRIRCFHVCFMYEEAEVAWDKESSPWSHGINTANPGLKPKFLDSKPYTLNHQAVATAQVQPSPCRDPWALLWALKMS
jgi:hypothetical protein